MKQIVWTSLCLVLCFSSLNGQSLSKVSNVAGMVVDQASNESFPFVLLDLMDSSGVIDTHATDLDGRFAFCFCDKRLISGRTTLRARGPGYHSAIYTLVAGGDTAMIIPLARDTAISPPSCKDWEAFLRADPRMQCGTEWYEHMRSTNPVMRHCDGTTKRFNDLDVPETRWCEWDRL